MMFNLVSFLRMRTTLTIDEDIALKLKSEAKKAGDKSFKAIVNETLRRGLMMSNDSGKTKRFKVRSRALGPRHGLNYDNIGELLEQIEDTRK